jgi:hypothetical protein
MSMFETSGRAPGQSRRNASTQRKLERLRRTLRHEQPDRVPISDFFWGSFTRRWAAELGLPPDANPYYHYDLDWIVTVPNVDPWIRSFETLKESQDEVVVRTGFGAVMRKIFALPMPEMVSWEVAEFDQLERAVFDAPDDPRRFLAAGDNQISGVGDGFQRNSPAWLETVRSLHPDFPVFGSVIEVSECLTRLVGQGNAMLWTGLYPEAMGQVANRIGEFYLECAKAELAAGRGLLDGFVIWGDVAYQSGTFTSPDYWREYFRPWVARIVDAAHAEGLPVIYHGCGKIHALMEDFIEIGVDALNPLEVKAGMDVVDLRRTYGHRIGFCGNSDMRVWEKGDAEALRREVLYRLNAARGGGYIFQSDHSVSSSVSGQTYDTIVKLVREYGRYPLELGEGSEAV